MRARCAHCIPQSMRPRVAALGPGKTRTGDKAAQLRQPDWRPGTGRCRGERLEKLTDGWRGDNASGSTEPRVASMSGGFPVRLPLAEGLREGIPAWLVSLRTERAEPCQQRRNATRKNGAARLHSMTSAPKIAPCCCSRVKAQGRSIAVYRSGGEGATRIAPWSCAAARKSLARCRMTRSQSSKPGSTTANLSHRWPHDLVGVYS